MTILHFQVKGGEPNYLSIQTKIPLKNYVLHFNLFDLQVSIVK
jgi:hypothetical protein